MLDDEIREIEARIAREREALAAMLHELSETTRRAVFTPQSLLAVAAIGYMLGVVLKGTPRRSVPTERARLPAVLGRAAAAILRARYGDPWMALDHLLTRFIASPHERTAHTAHAASPRRQDVS